MTEKDWPEFLTTAEVAEILRLSKMTVYRLMQSGELESIRVGRSYRVPAASLSHFLTGKVKAEN